MPKTPTQLEQMMTFLSGPDAVLLTPEGQRRMDQKHCLPNQIFPVRDLGFGIEDHGSLVPPHNQTPHVGALRL